VEPAKRDLTFLLAGPERRLLRGIAARLPRAIVPDHLTILGVVGAAGTALGYWLSNRDPAWLWLASGMLAVNWFGDSLDGTTARVRKIERPKYGYYLDHMVDGIITILIGGGIGLSGYVRLDVALLLVVVYLVLSINLYLEAEVFGVFEMGYGVFGPTEVRLLIVLANTVLWAGATWSDFTAAGVARVANVAFLALAGVMFVVFLLRFRINLIRLARQEPPRGGA
jgi:phosphatidylglycerophosphate synthase